MIAPHYSFAVMEIEIADYALFCPSEFEIFAFRSVGSHFNAIQTSSAIHPRDLANLQDSGTSTVIRCSSENYSLAFDFGTCQVFELP